VRFSFREIPDPASDAVHPRPIVDVVVEGLDVAPQACLLDSGATAVRLGVHVADLCGVDLSAAPKKQLGVGSALVTARRMEVALLLTDGIESYEWSAPVWFCDPWRPAFGLLGLTGFFDHFEVTIAAYSERVELTPITR
jgi:hypothetical protein